MTVLPARAGFSLLYSFSSRAGFSVLYAFPSRAGFSLLYVFPSKAGFFLLYACPSIIRLSKNTTYMYIPALKKTYILRISTVTVFQEYHLWLFLSMQLSPLQSTWCLLIAADYRNRHHDRLIYMHLRWQATQWVVRTNKKEQRQTQNAQHYWPFFWQHKIAQEMLHNMF